MGQTSRPAESKATRDWAQVDAGFRPYAKLIARRYWRRFERTGSNWHKVRAKTMRLKLGARRDDCQAGNAFLTRTCECGTQAAALPCGLWKICDRCSGQRRAKLRRRYQATLAQWSGRGNWRVYLWTFSVRHSGDVDRDLYNLAGIRETMLRYWFRPLAKQSQGRKPQHFSVIEWTKGKDGLPHVHCHVPIWCPRFNYSDAQAVFAERCQQQFDTTQQNFAMGTPAASDRGSGARAYREQTDKIGSYVAKHTLSRYVSKIASDSPDDDMLGQLIGQTHNRKLVQSGRKQLLPDGAVPPPCPCCAKPVDWVALSRQQVTALGLQVVERFGYSREAKPVPSAQDPPPDTT